MHRAPHSNEAESVRLMILGQTLKRAHIIFATLLMAMLLAFAPRIAIAQEAAEATADTASVEAAATAEGEAVEATTSAYTPMKPTEGKGMPVDGNLDVQPQFSPIGDTAIGLHNALIWVMAIISIFVLLLLVYVVVRVNKRANPTPSKTTHNTLIEVVWTLVPVLILVGIALPSISLLAKQYESPPEDAITVKAIGVQWQWEYEYPDYGVSFISKMLNIPGEPVVNNGVRELGSEPWDGPSHLEVDNRVVVPVGVPIRLQTTANDVIHSFAVPSLWFKLDAVPGRLNEKMLTIKEPGVYYGQCSELCGVKHGYMPIAIEAVPIEQFEAWVVSQGGTLPGAEPAPAAEGEATDEAATEAEVAAETEA